MLFSVQPPFEVDDESFDGVGTFTKIGLTFGTVVGCAPASDEALLVVPVDGKISDSPLPLVPERPGWFAAGCGLLLV